ncbi:13956_t:CDS:2, partial [Acaulospora colombiana]
MRFFGIFAALTAVTSVFAAPVAVPAPNAELAAKRAEVVVPVKIGKLAMALSVNTKGLAAQIEQIVADPTGEVTAVAGLVKPLLGQVVETLKDTLKGLAEDPTGTIKSTVNDVVGTVDGTVEGLTPEQLKDLLQGVIDVRSSLFPLISLFIDYYCSIGAQPGLHQGSRILADMST